MLLINGDTRQILVPKEDAIFGVTSDEKTNIKYFKGPRYTKNGIDLAAASIRINYINAGSETNQYIVTDLEADDENIIFSWTLHRSVTIFRGTVYFIVCAVITDENGNITNEWNTTSASGTVLQGIEVDGSAYEEEVADAIESILLAAQKRIDSMVVDDTLTQQGVAADSKMVGDRFSQLSEEIGKQTGAGLSTEAIDKLEEVGNYLAYTTADGGSKWTELISILRNGSSGGDSGDTDVTLTSIFATYTGGEVTTGTALSDLTGIIVTATYSDGTTKTITGYTLSGEILEGENTITVSYSGLTTTFTVTGIVESGGGEATAELPTDGLVSYFDFRTCEYNNAGSGGSTLIQPTQGNGQLFTWANNMVTEQNDYGMKVLRSFMFDENGGTTQSECGESFTWVFKCYLTSLSSTMFTNEYASFSNTSKIVYKPKYNTASSTAQVAGEGLGARLVDAYDLLILVVDKNICKLYFGNELIKEIDGNTIEGFVSWYSKLTFSIIGSNNAGYFSQLAIYNKALSDVEITEMKAYLETLEVA